MVREGQAAFVSEPFDVASCLLDLSMHPRTPLSKGLDEQKCEVRTVDNLSRNVKQQYASSMLASSRFVNAQITVASVKSTPEQQFEAACEYCCRNFLAEGTFPHILASVGTVAPSNVCKCVLRSISHLYFIVERMSSVFTAVIQQWLHRPEEVRSRETWYTATSVCTPLHVHPHRPTSCSSSSISACSACTSPSPSQSKRSRRMKCKS
jgi:hypothetical protein